MPPVRNTRAFQHKLLLAAVALGIYEIVVGSQRLQSPLTTLEPPDLLNKEDSRRKAFPNNVVESDDFSFGQRRVWLQPNAYKIFMRRDEGPWSDSVDTGNEPGAQLEAYRDFLLPPKMHTHSLFNLERVEDWVKHAPYLVFKALVYPNIDRRCKHNRHPPVFTLREATHYNTGLQHLPMQRHAIASPFDEDRL
ncbi:hypothetical protein M422DRAFT_239332 [Sphaerobolus stellatus SS14]|nr:hypothetical protein M422DRAFT_239332 [Sphaerobolus stellatus SS14]